METKLTTRDIRHNTWALQIQQQVNSGLTVAEWCDQNGLSRKAFYYRRKQVREELLQNAYPVFTELTSSCVEEQKIPNAFAPELTVSVGDAVIGVNARTTPHLLASVLKVVRNA